MYLFSLEPYKGNTFQKQDRDIKSLLKHSVQENSEEKERRMVSLTGWVHSLQFHIESLVYQSHSTLFLTKYWLWKKCLAQTSRTVNSSWLHICIKHRSSGRCAFWLSCSCLTVVFHSQAHCVTSPVVDFVHGYLFTWRCLFFGLITDKHWITPLLFLQEVKLQNWPLLLDNKHNVSPFPGLLGLQPPEGLFAKPFLYGSVFSTTAKCIELAG